MTPERPGSELPAAVLDLATRLGADADTPTSSVVLTQRGCMGSRPGGRRMRFRARQRISLDRPEFAWRATTGPFGCVRVLDMIEGGRGRLEVRAFGLVPLASVAGSAAAAKGEVMRYLAELAWAPDAILRNRALDWTAVDGRTLRVAAGAGEARGEVELRLDESGRIASVFASDRPRREAAAFVERPWQGWFFDYRRRAGRWLPFAAEVAWVLEEERFVTWQGEVLDWRLE